jgi:hypothetical protein
MKLWIQMTINSVLWICIVTSYIILGLPKWIVILFFVLTWIKEMMKLYEEHLDNKLKEFEEEVKRRW